MAFLGDLICQFAIEERTWSRPSSSSSLDAAATLATASASASGTTTAATAAADDDDKDGRFDPRRTFAFTAFGCLYQGFVCHWIYNAYPKLLPVSIVASNLQMGVACSLLDNFVHSPLLYTPAFYLSVGVMQGQTLGEASATLRDEFASTMLALWAVWIPIQALTFGLIPPPFRVIFMNGACLMWNIILDYKQAHAKLAHAHAHSHPHPQLQQQAAAAAAAAAVTETSAPSSSAAATAAPKASP